MAVNAEGRKEAFPSMRARPVSPGRQQQFFHVCSQRAIELLPRKKESKVACFKQAGRPVSHALLHRRADRTSQTAASDN